MSKMKITGNNKLAGTVKISGAKNSAVAIIPAAILSDEEVIIDNVPDISDVKVLEEILTFLNVDYKRGNDDIVISAKKLVNKEIPTEIAAKIRASYYFMGALLGKYKKVTMSLPGGCQIGARPINLHLKAFEQMGATITHDHSKIKIEAKKLKGAEIYLDICSVGATVNIILAAVKAKGTTTIFNAAKEPEIVNVANLLIAMGAKIYGAGTDTVKITGVEYLSGCHHEIIPDRIEAGTYAIIGALMGKNLRIENMIPAHLTTVLTKLKNVGAEIAIGTDYIIINKAKKLKPVNIKTAIYPGFPTDLQQPMTALLTQCQGESIVEENIYEWRFKNVEYLTKMGANIEEMGKKIIVNGPSKLKGAEIVSTDLRAGSCLIIAALIAKGETIINNAEHVLRGYEDIDVKLRNLGAKIRVYK